MRAVVAYSGSPADSATVASLAGRGHEVVTVTLDIGQSEPLDGIRARAIASGAIRAHVIDAREAFVRTCVLPAMRAAAADVEALPQPLIAKTLLEIADIEGAATAPRTPVPSSPAAGGRRERNLLMRPAVHPSHAPEAEARLVVAMENGIPVAINDVPMTLVELIESLSLIAGQHGIGHADRVQAPAAVILRAIYECAGETPAAVRLTLHKGTYSVLSSAEPVAVVTHS